MPSRSVAGPAPPRRTGMPAPLSPRSTRMDEFVTGVFSLPSSLQLDCASLIEIGLRLVSSFFFLRSDCPLERDDFSSNHHSALSFCLSMILSEKPGPTFPDHALVRLVLSRPQHFADAQHVFRGSHIHPVSVAETLRVAILSEFQYLGGSVGEERHGVDVLPLRPGQRRLDA